MKKLKVIYYYIVAIIFIGYAAAADSLHGVSLIVSTTIIAILLFSCYLLMDEN